MQSAYDYFTKYYMDYIDFVESWRQIYDELSAVKEMQYSATAIIREACEEFFENNASF